MIIIELSNENIIHVQKSDIEYIQFKRLLEYEDVLKHCFTLKPLDFGSNNTYEQQKETITDNYKKICNNLNLDYRDIVRPYQTHSDKVKVVEDDKAQIQPSIFLEEYREVDGLVTNQLNKILSLTYADCTPLYFFDPNKKAIANIHSGWLGTAKKIGKKAVEKLIETYKCNPKDIICCIGPTIRDCHFEVDKDVKEKFVKAFNNMFLHSVIRNKYYINTVSINKAMLLEAGLQEENIIDSGICTVCNSDLTYSYRGNNKTESRNTAIISLV